MKTCLRISIFIVILLCILLGWMGYKYPFLTPWYRTQYSAEKYRAIVDADTIPHDAAALLQAFDTRYPFWLGTRWDFNGVSETPGEGSIACGYFVTTMLRDMHIPIERVAMAQCASEVMIKSQVDAGNIIRFSGVNADTIFQQIEMAGDALYIIGLDNHTGFIRVEAGKAWFIHSSGRFPYRVIREDARGSSTIIQSQYKVFGCLSKSKVLF